MTELPQGPLIAWYGDDFTGSAATMEALTFAGLPAVLFFALAAAGLDADASAADLRLAAR
jgi:uncharacterized protein YgbK (DUF1537 family)